MTGGARRSDEPARGSDNPARLRAGRLIPFLRHLVFYLMIMAVPFLTILLFFYPRVRALMTSGTMRNHQEVVRELKVNVDDHVKGLFQVSAQLFHNPHMSASARPENGYARMLMQEELDKYVQTNSLIHMAFFHLKGSDYLISTTNSYSIETFDRYFYRYENWSQVDFLKTLRDTVAPVIRASETVYLNRDTRKELITVILPVPLESGRPYALCLFMIEASTLFQNGQSDTRPGMIFVVDRNAGSIVAAPEDLPAQALSSLLEAKGREGSITFTVEKRPYVLSFARSDVVGWVYAYASPIGPILRGVRKEQAISTALLLLVILIESLLVYYAMQKNYKPLARLRRYLARLPETRSDREPHGIDGAISLIQRLHDSNQAMQEEILRSKRTSLIAQLLSGGVGEDGLSWLEMEEAGIDIRGKRLAVAILVPGETPDRKAADCLMTAHELLSDHDPRLSVNTVINETDGCLIVLLATNKEDLQLPAAHLADVLEALGGRHGVAARAFLGSLVGGPVDLGRSFAEALSMMEHEGSEDGATAVVGGLHLYRASQAQDAVADSGLASRYRTSLAAGDSRSIQSVIDEACAVIGDERTPIHVVRTTFFELFVLQVSRLRRIDPRFDPQRREETRPPAPESPGYRERLAGVLRDLSTHMGAAAGNPDGSRRPVHPVEEVLAYVRRNFHRKDFSIRMAADQFGMSVSSLSHFVRRKTGVSFSGYVTFLRMEKAKELLTGTDLPVKKVAEAVGYWNDTSFVRTFRRTEDITPGRYRAYNSGTGRRVP